MKRMNKPARLLISVVFALVFSLGLANACMADFSDPILGNNNVYMLSAANGAWESSGSSQLNFRELDVQTYRYAEWPGATSGIESISPSEFSSLWEEGGAFKDQELIGALSIADGNGRVDYKVLIKEVRMNTEASTVEIVVDFGNAQGPDNSGDAILVIKDWHGPATETVRLNLTYDGYPPDPRIAIFQENLAGPAGGDIIVWKSISVGKGAYYVLTLRPDLTLSAMDSHGSSTTQLSVEHGQLYTYFVDYCGPCLFRNGAASNPNLLQVVNQDTIDTIEAKVSRNGGRLAAAKISPSKRLESFSFDQVLYIGIASDLKEGDMAAPDEISGLHKVPLSGIAQADIMVRGNEYEGYNINLENIEWR